MNARARRDLIERRARRLLQKRERLTNEPIVQRILNILAFRPQKTRRRLWGDPRIGMDYETLFECQPELGELMNSWVEDRCRLDEWRLKQQFEEDLNRRRLFLCAIGEGPVGFDFTPPIREQVEFGFGGGHQIDALPGRTAAVALFFQFITGPFQKDIGRCKRCRKFFWNRSGRKDKVYCGSRCASAVTATARTRERRTQERRDKLRSAQNAIRTFNRLSPERRSRIGPLWASWVAEEAAPGVTSNFITRAINRGELKRPATIARQERT